MTQKETKAPTTKELARDLPDGIYFNLPEDVYHKVEALGSTDIGNLNISPADFWKNSWFNPDNEKEDGEEDEDATKAQILGRAYHVARLEPERFDDVYIRQPEKSEFPKDKLLTSDAAIKAALKARGLPQTEGTETIEQRAGRLVADGFEDPIWHLIMQEFENERTATKPHKIGISATYFDDIRRDIQRIDNNPEVKALITGGFAEVSVIWTDVNGIRCKARFDYLKANSWSDFKTFENSMRKGLERCIRDAFQYNGYYLQATHYRDAADAIRSGNLKVQDGTKDQKRLIDMIMERDRPLACYYIFQQKGGVPNLLAYQFQFMQIDAWRDVQIDIMLEDENQAALVRDAMSTKSALWMRGRRDVNVAKQLFMLYSQTYLEGEPWAPIEAIRVIGDADFNPRWLEGEYK